MPDTFGGFAHTPTLTKLRDEGICYNRFHTTSICSPTRAALLTGRNHQRVGNGTIAERAVDWDGYTGVIPKTSATLAEVLKNYGYSTSAFGKWHNTPADQTTEAGPFAYWPTSYGFEHFYGFLAGETSQWEPRHWQIPLGPKFPATNRTASTLRLNHWPDLARSQTDPRTSFPGHRLTSCENAQLPTSPVQESWENRRYKKT